MNITTFYISDPFVGWCFALCLPSPTSGIWRFIHNEPKQSSDKKSFNEVQSLVSTLSQTWCFSWSPPWSFSAASLWLNTSSTSTINTGLEGILLTFFSANKTKITSNLATKNFKVCFPQPPDRRGQPWSEQGSKGGERQKWDRGRGFSRPQASLRKYPKCLINLEDSDFLFILFKTNQACQGTRLKTNYLRRMTVNEQKCTASAWLKDMIRLKTKL